MHCGTWFLATGLCFLGCRATPNTSSNHSPEPSHSSLETHATSTDTPLASPPTLSGQATTTTNAMAISIHISLEAEQAQLGHPIPLRVEFKNEGSSAVTFLEPARTWELALQVGRPDGAPEGTAAPFGKIFYTNYNGLERRSVEDAAEVSLAPGETHYFLEDVGTRWPHLFGPGTHRLRVINRIDPGEIASNVVSVQVLLAEASVPKLFEFAERSLGEHSSTNQSSEDGMVVATRRFAAEWIAYLLPGFELDPTAAGPEAEAKNHATVAEARAAWARQQRNPEMFEKIKLVNRRASQSPPRRDESN